MGDGPWEFAGLPRAGFKPAPTFSIGHSLAFDCGGDADLNALHYTYFWSRFQKGPVIPSSLRVAIISNAYSRLRETQSGSKRFRKKLPEKSFTRLSRGTMPSSVPALNCAQFLMWSSDRKRFMVLQE